MKCEQQEGKRGFWSRAVDLYVDGFRHMHLGKTLWLIILIKLFIIFFVLKLFFFPNFLSRHATNGDKAGYVSNELIGRGTQTEAVAATTEEVYAH